MKKRLSTSMTFFWKYIFSSIWLGGFGIGTIAAIFTLGAEGLLFLIGLIFGYAMIYYGCLRAKNVHIDDNYLYVSNYRKNIQIPLDNIKNVSDNIMFSPRPIFIEFNNQTEFGKKIMFIGYTEMFLFCSTHPAVKEVKNRIKKIQRCI
ncbi:hypothetical protein [Reichenbachiella sp.]|uniref:hypothetical protein n=1 Tax=Reichenbachiella sp. TaxID=2184521 RepID=UPI003BB15F88